ncbi:MAG: sigma-70 family RNA polymerase sigma factor [Ruminococcus sp.]|nr:sigma-70 family RNA polymerase sigma factor [Ruminococcus sp.]
MISFYLSLLDTPEEKSKFEQLYRLYRQDMFKMAYGILENKYDTEDAVHEAFMRVMKKLTKISEINCPQTHAYLLIIVKNTALKILKKRKKTIDVDTDTIEIADDFGLEEYVISNMEVEHIKHILEQLSDDYYEVLFLELFMEFSISDIAEQLGLTYENTKKRLQRAKKKFKEIAEEKENAK